MTDPTPTDEPRSAYDQAYYDAVQAGDEDFDYAQYPLPRMEVAPPVAWLMKHGWGSSPLKDKDGVEVGQGPDGFIFPIVLLPYFLQDAAVWQAFQKYARAGIEAYTVPRYGRMFVWGIDELPPEGYLSPGWVSYTTMSFPGRPGKTFTNPEFFHPADEPPSFDEPEGEG
jgi:hypothetical protein